MAVVPKQSGIDILRNFIPLNTLSDDSLKRLLASAEFGKVRKGETLFNEGDKKVARIYLLSGRVALLEQGEEAYQLSAGDNMARYPLAHHIPRKYSAVAKNRVETVSLDNVLLGDLLAAASNSSYDVEEVDSELTDDWMSKLLQSPIFQQLPAASIQQVMMHMDEFLVVAGQAVIQEDDEGDYFYLVNSGTALVTRAGEDGEVDELARLGPGATFGEESLLSDTPRGSTVTMLTDGVLLRLDKSRFVEFVKTPLADSIEYSDAVSKVRVGAVWVDVRSEKEHNKGHIPSSLNIPFNRLRNRLSDLDSSKVYIAYCQDGMVSATAVFLLMNAGYEAYLLSRGLQSVPENVLKASAGDNGAQIINLRPDSDETSVVSPPSVEDQIPEDEAGLLRQQLHSTEDQMKEQILHARKLKLLINKLKGNLSIVEEGKAASLRAQAEQTGKLKELQAKLRDMEKSRGADQELLQQGDGYRKELEEVKVVLAKKEAAAQQEVDGLELLLAETKHALLQAEGDLRELRLQGEQDKAAADSERETVNSRQDELNRELERVSALLKSAEAEQVAQSEMTQKIALLEDARREAVEALAELQSQVDQDKAITEEDREAALLHQGDLRRELDQLKRELEQANGRSSSVQAELDAKSELVDELSRQKEILEADAGERERLSQEVEGLRSAIAEAEQQQVLNADQLQRRSEEINTLEQERGELAAQQLADSEELRAEEREKMAEQERVVDHLRNELGGKGVALDQATQHLADESSKLSDLNETLDQLRIELNDSALQREQLEKQLASQEALPDEATIAQLRQELEEALTAQESAETALLETGNLPTSDAQQEQINVLEMELKTINQALDGSDEEYAALEQKNHALERQLEALSAQQQEVNQVSVEQAVGESAAEIDSLKEELLRVQTQADADVSDFKSQLKESQLKTKERELSGEADVAENEGLRQEKSDLRLSLNEHQNDLQRSRKESSLLEERIEERNSEVDRLNSALQIAREELDVSRLERQAALEEKESSEQVIHALQQDIESDRPNPELFDSRINTASLNTSPEPSGGLRRLLVPLIVALFAFGVADLLSIMNGKGELISGFIGGDATVESTDEAALNDDVPIASAETQPPLVAKASLPPEGLRKKADVIAQSNVEEVIKPAKVMAKAVVEAPVKKVAETAVVVPVVIPPPEKPTPPVQSQGPVTGTAVRDALRFGGQAPEMVYLQGGTFTMGSDRNQLASEERPAHSVAISNFLIGRNEVTYRDYAKFTQATGRSLPSDLGWGKGGRPVINVSWDDARNYALWLSEQTGKRYRLPTEAEWEYAASAGTDTLYWWGFKLGDNRANCFNCGSKWDGQSTAPVGAFEANAFGVENTAGNVMEWVSDCYHASYAGAPVDGSAWLEKGCRERVVRGGAFNKPGDSLRSTRRGGYDADTKLFVLGFRLARDVSRKN